MVRILWRWYRMDKETLAKWRISKFGAVVDGRLYVRSLIPHPNLWYQWKAAT